ncbi:MAG: alternative ribosome rescue aminoacyl-tRNA hydrolase ArfB [Cellulophaga sp.]|uniref:alternative ribosome rescue aminoacyl-tRNA hydrolase ArfB n=1 Tax=Cellulophaga sp. TaxID=1972202 RepID=UPI003264FD0A
MNSAQIIQELQFKAVRSSGAGGQHVNKVSTKIELTYDLQNSTAVTDKEKERLLLKLSNRLTKENVLLLQCDDSRSQHKNKDLVIKRFLELVKSALIVPKKRKKTKPSRSAIEKRLNTKKKSALKKANRKKPSLE